MTQRRDLLDRSSWKEVSYWELALQREVSYWGLYLQRKVSYRIVVLANSSLVPSVFVSYIVIANKFSRQTVEKNIVSDQAVLAPRVIVHPVSCRISKLSR